MYSVVLMMALTGGGDVPAGLFSHGCCGGGCYGSCYGGCYGSCFGCSGGYGCCGGKHGHGHSRRGHGCCGGGSCFGCCGGGYAYGCCGGGHGHGHFRRSHGCCGGGYGCCGGCYGGSCFGSSCYGGGCYGSSCFGGVGAGCLGGAGCVGGVGGVISAPVAPSTVAPAAPAAPATQPENGKKTSIDNAAPATLVVNVPADARLTVDGEATTSTSTQRVFVSPNLEAGREYHYTLQAEFVKDGKPVTVNKEVAVRAGQETRVTLDASLAGVASR